MAKTMGANFGKSKNKTTGANKTKKITNTAAARFSIIFSKIKN
jgi:hypothetical protein